MPALARILKTDFNTLLCYKESLTEQEIGDFLNQVAQKIDKEGFESGFEAAMDQIQEYPNCAGLLESASTFLEGSLLLSGVGEEEREGYRSQILALYERAAESSDPDVAVRARYMLASKWINAGKYEKAREMADRLPEWNALDKRRIQANIWEKTGKTEEAAELLERKLFSNIWDNIMLLDQRAAQVLSEGNQAPAEAMAKCAGEECRIFGIGGYSCDIVSLRVAVSRKSLDDSLRILTSMLAAVMAPWKMDPVIFPHMAQNYKRASANIGKMILKPLFTALEKNSEYDFLRSSPEFQKLLEEYHEKCS